MDLNELNDYFIDIVNLLEEYKWIYDFQVIDIFNNEILEDKFPIEVKKFLILKKDSIELIILIIISVENIL